MVWTLDELLAAAQRKEQVLETVDGEENLRRAVLNTNFRHTLLTRVRCGLAGPVPDEGVAVPPHLVLHLQRRRAVPGSRLAAFDSSHHEEEEEEEEAEEDDVDDEPEAAAPTGLDDEFDALFEHEFQAQLLRERSSSSSSSDDDDDDDAGTRAGNKDGFPDELLLDDTVEVSSDEGSDDLFYETDPVWALDRPTLDSSDTAAANAAAAAAAAVAAVTALTAAWPDENDAPASRKRPLDLDDDDNDDTLVRPCKRVRAIVPAPAPVAVAV